jgi:hypothetical protein
MEAIDDHARKARSGSGAGSTLHGGEGNYAEGMGSGIGGQSHRVQSELAILYGMAEGEALRDLCVVIDEVSLAVQDTTR